MVTRIQYSICQKMPILLISMILSQWHAFEIRATGEKYSIAPQACILTRLLFICMIIDKGGLVIMTCHLRINILLQRKTKRTYVKQQQQQQLCYYGFYWVSKQYLFSVCRAPELKQHRFFLLATKFCVKIHSKKLFWVAPFVLYINNKL